MKQKVKSSNLEFVEYIADKKELRIWFLNEKNGIYAYENVPQEIYDELIKASSIGGFFIDRIKYKYTFKRMLPEEIIDEELKTLKDFGETCYEHIGNRVYTGEDLKQEAIKWVKNIEKNEFVHALSNKIDQRCLKDAVIPWIKHFFNISDGDLKCQKAQ